MLPVVEHAHLSLAPKRRPEVLQPAAPDDQREHVVLNVRTQQQRCLCATIISAIFRKQ